MYDNIGFLLKVFSRITVKLNKRNASTLLKLQNVIKGGIQPNARVSRTQGGIWNL